MILTRTEQEMLKARAHTEGFLRSEFLSYQKPSDSFRNFYRNYLEKKFHAEMKYMENVEARFDAGKILADVKSVLVLVHPYRTEEGEKLLRIPGAWRIARYALGRDYHRSLRRKMKRVLGEYDGRGVVDSAPFPERWMASQSSLGFIGKNGMFIDRELGSYVWLAFILFSHELETEVGNRAERPDFSECGTCRLCMDACPSGAITSDALVDSHKCISYQTIENKEGPDFSGKKHSWIFGCDICQQVCPFNRGEKGYTGDTDFSPGEAAHHVSRGELESLTNEDLSGTALRRRGIEGLRKSEQALVRRNFK